ncbi:hypothetical protein DIPPA_27577 [Diplonema papillatum]|nr:hypothetical protein DIPPA_27577 [Diplonema papillatum]
MRRTSAASPLQEKMVVPFGGVLVSFCMGELADRLPGENGLAGAGEAAAVDAREAGVVGCFLAEEEAAAAAARLPAGFALPAAFAPRFGGRSSELLSDPVLLEVSALDELSTATARRAFFFAPGPASRGFFCANGVSSSLSITWARFIFPPTFSSVAEQPEFVASFRFLSRAACICFASE